MSNSASIAAAKKRRSQQINPIISSKIKNNNIQNTQVNQNNEIHKPREKITPLQLLAQHDERLFYLERKEKNNNDITNSGLVVSDNKLSNKIENNSIEISGLHNKINKIGNDVNGINELIKTMNAIIMSQTNELSKLKSDFYNYINEVTNLDNENYEENNHNNVDDNIDINRDMEKHVKFEISEK